MDKKELKDLACSMWLESANAMSAYKPMSFQNLVSELLRKGHKVGRTTLMRWCNDDCWNEKLQAKKAHIYTATPVAITDKQDINLLKKITNNSVKSAEIMENFLDNVKMKIKQGGMATMEEVELAVKIFAISSNTGLKLEDKEGDNNKITRQQIESRLETIDAQIEE